MVMLLIAIKKEGKNKQSPSWSGLSVSSLFLANPALTSKRFIITSGSWKLLINVDGFAILMNIHFDLCSQVNENVKNFLLVYMKTFLLNIQMDKA